ncbi:helix-turn-helix domain-containing protein [Streptomyces sp. NBRC 109706]|uniref:helix-turn-helix domain-containing protein n=1 Tax=Streptomyces sp. NBRC 109706 TaxID=1550035 RepID=UPI000781B087|nr:helix-turn-helix domain-containing protein [Streptomyces sp. NBRC 109706]
MSGIDKMAVDAVLSGGPPDGLSRRERVEATARLRSRGWSARQIAGRLGVCQRTVSRYIAELREAGR